MTCDAELQRWMRSMPMSDANTMSERFLLSSTFCALEMLPWRAPCGCIACSN